MSATTPQIKFTYQDYLLFPNDGKRYELIAGDRYVTPAPRTKHQRISGNLYGLLFEFVKQNKSGILLSAPTDVVFSDMDVVQPDLLFVSWGRESIITEDNIQGAPDLVVEILSESTRRTDEIIKRKLYEKHGVAEYWIIDPEIDTVKVFRLVDQTYSQAIELTLEAQARVTSPLFPGWELPLKELFP
ncbi:MAG: Uma2 family endonuclease [Nitrospirota bacterium]|nr:MAG: Uma2 family endonuclease [Nitrospirota bacterium]